MAHTIEIPRQKRANLAKKIIAQCPCCKFPITGGYVLKSKNFEFNYSNATHFPIAHVIKCPNHPREKIRLYLDANLAVRDLQAE